MIEATVDDLFRTIGRLTVENQLLRQQLVRAQELLEARAAKDLEALLEAERIQAQIDGKVALKEVAEKQLERLERIT